MARSPPLPIDASFRQPQQSFQLLEASGSGPTAIDTLASAQKSTESFASVTNSLSPAATILLNSISRTGQPGPDNDMLAPSSGSQPTLYANSLPSMKYGHETVQVPPRHQGEPTLDFTKARQRLSASDDDYHENAHLPDSELQRRREHKSSSSSSSSSPPPLIGADGRIQSVKKASIDDNQQDINIRSENVQENKKEQSDEKKLTLQDLLATNKQYQNRNSHTFQSAQRGPDHNQIIIISGGAPAQQAPDQTGRTQVRGHPSSLQKQQKQLAALAMTQKGDSRSPERQTDTLPFTSLYRQQQQQQIMNHHSFYPQKALDGFAASRLQHTTQPTNGFGTDELRHATLDTDEPQSLTMRDEVGFSKSDYKVNSKSTKNNKKKLSPKGNVIYPHHQYYPGQVQQQQQTQPQKDQNVPEYRHFFRPVLKKPVQQKFAASTQDCKQVIMEWFASLSDTERINALTTVCPVRIENLLLWYRGELSNSHQQPPQEQYHFQQPHSYFMTKEELMLIPITLQGKISPEYQSHHISPTAGYTPSAKNFYLQGRYPQDSPLHIGSLYQPPGYGSMVDYNLGNMTRLKNMREFLDHIRLADYQSYLDTLTVDQSMVEDPSTFFFLMDELTDRKAFTKPISLTAQQKGGKLQVDMPWWTVEHGKTANFFTLWIAAMLEETLWSHFFYNLIVANSGQKNTIKWEESRQIRKHELANLFENRTDNTALQSQEDLANYLKSIGKNGQKKLFEKLKERARLPPFQLPQLLQSGGGLSDFETESKVRRKTAKNLEKGAKTPDGPQQQDVDMKEIQESMLYLIKHNSQLHAIKFLSESPFGREGSRKDQLCREMLQLISEDLRLSVQNQLMNDEQRKASVAQQAKTQTPVLFPSFQQAPVQAAPAVKGKPVKKKGSKKKEEDEGKIEQKEEEQPQQIVLKRGGKGAKKRKAAARIATIAQTVAVLQPTSASNSIVQQQHDETVSPQNLNQLEFVQVNSTSVMAEQTESHQQQQQEQADIQPTTERVEQKSKPSSISSHQTTRQEAVDFAIKSPRQQETTGSTVSHTHQNRMDDYRPQCQDDSLADALAFSPISQPSSERSPPPNDGESSRPATDTKSPPKTNTPSSDKDGDKNKTSQQHSQQGRIKGDLIQSDKQFENQSAQRRKNHKQLQVENKTQEVKRMDSISNQPQAIAQQALLDTGSRSQRRSRKSTERQRSLVREYVSSLVNGLIDRVAAATSPKTAAPPMPTRTVTLVTAEETKSDQQPEKPVQHQEQKQNPKLPQNKEKQQVKPNEEKEENVQRKQQKTEKKVQDDKISTATATSVASDQSLVMNPTKNARRRKARKKGANQAELMNNFQRNMFTKQNNAQSQQNYQRQQQNQNRKDKQDVPISKSKGTNGSSVQFKGTKQQQQPNSGRNVKVVKQTAAGTNFDTLSTSSSNTNIGGQQLKKLPSQEEKEPTVTQEILLIEESSSGTQQTTQQLSIFHELNESLMTSTTAAGGKSDGNKEASEEIDSFIDVDVQDEEQQPCSNDQQKVSQQNAFGANDVIGDEMIYKLEKFQFAKENIFSGKTVAEEESLTLVGQVKSVEIITNLQDISVNPPIGTLECESKITVLEQEQHSEEDQKIEETQVEQEPDDSVLTLQQQTSKLSTNATAFVPTAFPPSSPILDQYVQPPFPQQTSPFYQQHNKFNRHQQVNKPPYMQQQIPQNVYQGGSGLPSKFEHKIHQKQRQYGNFEVPSVQTGFIEPINTYPIQQHQNIVFNGEKPKSNPFQPNVYPARARHTEYQKPQPRRQHPEHVFSEEAKKGNSYRNSGQITSTEKERPNVIPPINTQYQKGQNRRNTNNLVQSKKDEVFMQLKKNHSVSNIGDNYLAPKEMNQRVASGNNSPRGSNSSANGSANNGVQNRRGKNQQRFKGGSSNANSVYSLNDQQQHSEIDLASGGSSPTNIRLNAPPYDPSSDDDHWKGKQVNTGMQGTFQQMMPSPPQQHHHGGQSRLHNVVQNLFESLTTTRAQSPTYNNGGFSMSGPSTPVPFHGNTQPPNVFQGSPVFNTAISGFNENLRSVSYPNTQQVASRGMHFDGPQIEQNVVKTGQSPPPLPNEYPQQLDFIDFESEFYKKFDQNIIEYCGDITYKIADWAPERSIVLERINSIACKIFSNQQPELKQFGSLMTGLANEQSDMDMAVTGLNINDRFHLIEEMHRFADGLAEWDLIQDLKAIDTASIPVIKANINLDSLRALRMGEEEHISEKEKSEGRLLALDITFDDSPPENFGQQQQSQQPFMAPMMGGGGQQFQAPLFTFPGQPSSPFPQFGQDANVGGFSGFGLPSIQKTHLGLASCSLLKDYVGRYACLREVAVLLKRFLALQNLNVPYNGGISSYSLVLLIVGYMNCYKLQQSPQLTPSRLLMGFLDFYGNSFNPRQFGINTINDESFYPLQMAQYNEMQFQIVDPVNPTNNTARNSQQTVTILKKFRDIHRSLKLLSSQQQQRFLEGEAQRVLTWKPPTGGESATQTEQKASAEEQQRQNADSAKGQASQGAELTDGALEQHLNHYQAAQQKAQEQQQELPPAEGSAGQEGTAGAHEKQTTRDVDPVKPSPSHMTTGVAGSSQAAAERPPLNSIFDSFDFVARFLSLYQPQEDEQAVTGSSGQGGRV